MEGLLILLGIWILEVVVKKITAKKQNAKDVIENSKESTDVNENSDESELDENDWENANEDQNEPPKSLQDLIKQFEEAQGKLDTESTNNNKAPADVLENDEIKKEPAPVFIKKSFTLREAAEFIVQKESVCIKDLMQMFSINESVANQLLFDLQANRIVGRDMNGLCDVLVHDNVELSNIFSHKNAAKQAKSEAQNNSKEPKAPELNTQKLSQNVAPEIKNAAQTTSNKNKACEQQKTLQKQKINLATARRGFIWAKLLDEPRFKKQWSPRYR